MVKRFVVAFLSLFCAITLSFTSFATEISTVNGLKTAVDGVLSYKSSTLSANSSDELIEALADKAGSFTADWYFIAMSQYGVKIENKECVANLKSSLEEIYDKGLETAKVTDMQRIAFALLACGEDITNVNGHSLLADCTYNRALVRPLDAQGSNSVAYALLLLNSKNYKVPSDAAQTKKEMINTILSHELENGGYALFGAAADIDITTIVVQALAPYLGREDVRRSVTRCLDILSKRQQDDGAYRSFANRTCAESTAQVVLALTSLDINPFTDKRFVKNGNSVMDGLMEFRKESGGFCHFLDSPEDNIACYQSLMALVSCYRMLKGEKSFYDFTEKAIPTPVEITTIPQRTKPERTSSSRQKTCSSAKSKNNSSVGKTEYTSQSQSSYGAVTEPQTPETESNTAASSAPKASEKPYKTETELSKPTTTNATEAVSENTSQKATEASLYINQAEPKPNHHIGYIEATVLLAAYILVIIVRSKK